MAGQPAMGVGGVKQVQLAPCQVAQRRGDGVGSGALDSMDGSGDEKKDWKKHAPGRLDIIHICVRVGSWHQHRQAEMARR